MSYREEYKDIYTVINLLCKDADNGVDSYKKSVWEIDDKGRLIRYNGSEAIVKIPYGIKELYGYSELTSSSGRFEGCFEYNEFITQVIIPDSVEIIGSWCFLECKYLNNVVVPGSVKSIDSCAFQDCKSLTNIVLSEGIRHIGSRAFAFCSNLEKITIPKSVKFIDDEVFTCCRKLKKIHVFQDLDISNTDYPDSCDVARYFIS